MFVNYLLRRVLRHSNGRSSAVDEFLRRSLLTGCSTDAKLTPMDARGELRRIVGSPLVWGDPPQRDPSAQSSPPTKQSDLPARKMLDSYREAVIPLSKDKQLWQKYINFYHRVRLGRILEDLDTMAVLIGYSHNSDPSKGSDQKSSIAIVTALVDCISIRGKAMRQDRDVILRGHTTWVGNTSMEISLNVDQESDGGALETFLAAKFLMVARNPNTQSKAIVNPLCVETPEEKAYFEAGEANRSTRQLEASVSLLKTPPNAEERLTIHDLFLKMINEKSGSFKRLIKPDNSVWMEEAGLKNILICFPQNRNLYNKIFGGYLMRQGFELAWTNACVFSKTRPRLVAVDDIIFRRPVEIGSLLFLSSQVVYTRDQDLHVKVHAEVVNPTTGSHDTTNIFHFTFTTENVIIPTVMPKSYADYMQYLDGKRRYEKEIGRGLTQ